MLRKQSNSVYRRLSLHAHRQSASTQHEKVPVERASYIFEIVVLLIFAAPGRTEDVYTFTEGAQQAIGVEIISRYKINVQCRNIQKENTDHNGCFNRNRITVETLELLWTSGSRRASKHLSLNMHLM